MEDVISLQDELDNMNFQLKLRNSAITEQISDLRKKIQNYFKSQLSSKDIAISALQEQIKFIRQQCAERKEHKKECK